MQESSRSRLIANHYVDNRGMLIGERIRAALHQPVPCFEAVKPDGKLTPDSPYHASIFLINTSDLHV